MLPLATANGQMTQEDRVVRTTYAKLAYAMKIGAIHELLRENGQPGSAELEYRLAAKAIKFELSNLSSGSVNDIAKRVYTDLVTKPNGEDVLFTVTVTYNSTEDLEKTREVRETSEMGAQADWAHGQDLTGEVWNLPFERVLAIAETQNKSKYSRYASYRVTVSYVGRSRSYNAMFLFGSGEVPVLVLDNVTNSSALATFVSKSVYPAVLLESSVAQNPAVANWLKSHQVRDPLCRPGQRQVCCDPATLTCGVAEADVSSTLSKPISRVLRPSRPLSATAPTSRSPRFLTVSAPALMRAPRGSRILDNAESRREFM
jgi:hypothetical protein